VGETRNATVQSDPRQRWLPRTTRLASEWTGVQTRHETWASGTGGRSTHESYSKHSGTKLLLTKWQIQTEGLSG
jgi:hypothetical protein